MRDELMGRAWDMGLGEKVLFPGFIDDQTRNSLYRLASAAVFPSRYEPFGIVALEAMAGEAPVIVSDVGGFYETVEHGVNGLTFYAGNAHSLADSILRLLQDKALASALKKQALKDVSEDYNWETIALETLACYGRERAALRMREPIYERYHVTAELPQKGAPPLRESSNHGRR